jgi:hypothetical protein
MQISTKFTIAIHMLVAIDYFSDKENGQQQHVGRQYWQQSGNHPDFNVRSQTGGTD